jgi:hypothetical protein
MATLHLDRLTTDAVLATLKSSGAFMVGDTDAPTGAGWQDTPGSSTFKGYCVLYPLGGTSDGTLANPDEDVVVRYQTSCVGATRRQAQDVADRVRVVMLTWPIVVPGRRVCLVRSEMLAGAFREDEGNPPLWTVPDRYRLYTEPS